MLPILLATLIFAYFIYAAHVLELHKPALEALRKPIGDWFGEAGNPVRAGVWAGASVVSLIAWLSSETSFLGEMRGEITGMATTVIIIDELVGYRNRLQEKKHIIQQLSSRSNDFALDAARIIEKEGWHRDGSLKNIKVEWANLANVYLPRAKFSNAHFHHSNLQNAILYLANLDGGKFVRCNFEGISLISASLLGTEFYNVNLNEADLVNIKARGIQFHSVNFEGAAMKSANLEDADFLLGSLKNAILTGTNLRGANLKTVGDLETANLKDAVYNKHTIFPDGFDPVAAGAIKVDDAA